LQRFDVFSPLLAGALSNHAAENSSCRYFEAPPLAPPDPPAPAPEEPPPAEPPEPEPIAALAPLLAVPLGLLLIIFALPPLSLACVPLTALLSGLVDVSGDCCVDVPLALIPLSTLVDVEFCAKAAPEAHKPKPRTAENRKRDMFQTPEKPGLRGH
jgi:hypothetical protein